jgi:hypothetical protein
VLEALNGFDVGGGGEIPQEGDAAFAAAVDHWRQARGVGEVEAALWCTLCEAPDPSRETQVLRALAEGETAGAELLDGVQRRWLAQAARLFGLNLDHDLGSLPAT